MAVSLKEGHMVGEEAEIGLNTRVDIETQIITLMSDLEEDRTSPIIITHHTCTTETTDITRITGNSIIRITSTRITDIRELAGHPRMNLLQENKSTDNLVDENIRL